MRTVRSALPIAALVAVAATCGFLAYDAFARDPSGPHDWTRASAAARRADATKAKLPAIQIRNQAIGLFRDLARSGPPATRSRAEMLAGLLRIRNYADDDAAGREQLSDAAAALQRAVRLDRANDDAAYDLELLLSQAKQSGKPIPQRGVRISRHGKGRPGVGQPGTGY